MDWATVSEELRKPLDSKHVQPPPQGKYGEYIQGWHAIAEANRIFGEGNWSYEVISADEVHRELHTLQGRDGDYQQWRVTYVAKVRVRVGDVVREDIAAGQGQAKPANLGDAIESAAKESVTDALKRALRTFGNPFGLALYDKTKSNVVDMDAEKRANNTAIDKMNLMDSISTSEELDAFWKGLKRDHPEITNRDDVIAKGAEVRRRVSGEKGAA